MYENPEKAKIMGYEGSQNISLHSTMEKHLNTLAEIINKAIDDTPAVINKTRVIVSNKKNKIKKIISTVLPFL